MRKADHPKPVRSGWPFVTVSMGDGLSLAFKVPTVPSRRAMVLDAFIKGQIKAAGKIEEAKGAEGEDAAALADEGLMYAEGSTGRLLADLWWPVAFDLESPAKWDAGEYKGPDSRFKMGQDVVCELADDLGLTWDEIAKTASALSDLLSERDAIDGERVAEVQTFFGVQPDSKD